MDLSSIVAENIESFLKHELVECDTIIVGMGGNHNQLALQYITVLYVPSKEIPTIRFIDSQIKGDAAYYNLSEYQQIFLNMKDDHLEESYYFKGGFPQYDREKFWEEIKLVLGVPQDCPKRINNIRGEKLHEQLPSIFKTFTGKRSSGQVIRICINEESIRQLWANDDSESDEDSESDDDSESDYGSDN